MTALEKSLILSYLHTKQAIANLEVAVHEMRVLGNGGSLQHRMEKLAGVSRKAFKEIESNLEGNEELVAEMEEELSKEWDKLI
jgi:flagellar motor switch protein FliG